MEHEKQIINLFKIFIQSIAVVANNPHLTYQQRNNLINLIDKAESEINIIEAALYREQINEPDGPIGLCLECGVNHVYNGIRCNSCDEKILNKNADFDLDLPF